MGCGGFHGNAYPPERPLSLHLCSASQSVLQGAEPTLQQTILQASKPLLIQFPPVLASLLKQAPLEILWTHSCFPAAP